LEFLAKRLQALGVREEAYCPAKDLDLLDWVDAGLEFAWQAWRDRPDQVRGISPNAPANGWRRPAV